MLNVHTIKPARGAKHSKKRVGRGNASGHGTSSTRGGKGQTARSGGSRGLKMLGFKFLLQSTPKLRGFTSRQTKPAEVYLSDLEKHFDAGATITLAALQEKNLIGATVKQVKIVGTGELKKKVSLSGILATKGAAAAITKAGGDIK
jgi:large subunit ribosomal protein L15